MNLTHVLSFGSSFSSSALRRTYEHGCCNDALVVYRHTGLNISFRSSDGESREGYGEGRKSANGVSDLPRYSREQNGGSRGNYSGGSKGGHTNSNSRRYGGSDYKGGVRLGRNRKKQMHPGAYSMVDEQTGEKVIVWGVETDDDIPVPTANDLDWKKTIMAVPGDASDDVWAKIIENSGFNDTYSVKGVEQGGRDWVAELYEEDIGDDEEDEILDDEAFDDYETESDNGAEEVRRIESKKVWRAPRLKVFGRDVRGKSLLKVQTISEEKDKSLSFSGKASYDTQTVVESRYEGSSLEVTSDTENSDVFELSDKKMGDVESDIRDDHLLAEPSPTSSGSKVGEISSDEKVLKKENSFVKHSEESHKTLKTIPDSRKRDQKAQGSNNATENEKALPSFSDKLVEGSGRVLDTLYTPPDSYKSDAFSEVPSTSFGVNVETTRGSKLEKIPAPGEYYIIDVTDDDEGSTRRKQYDEVKEGKKLTLLDQLRLQATGKMPMSKENSESVGRSSEDEEISPLSQSPSYTRQSKDAVNPSPPITLMRNLKTRDNYDASIADEFFSQKSFLDVGATEEVIRALAYLQVEKPSQIQALSFTPIVQGKSCILAEQTGSGKTLAYVAPLVQRLRADEASGMGKALPKKPRVLVLVPTSELAAQVLQNFRALSKGGMPTRSIVLTGGFKWKTQVENLEEGADVVIATPGRLLQHLDAGTINFDHVKSVVFDEVDILFEDEEFSKALQTINKTASIKVQYVHVTATLPVDIHDEVLERYPDCLSLMGPSLHRPAPGLQEILVDCSGGETDAKTPESAFANKRTALLQLVNDKPVSKTIIFCNKIDTCRKVENILTRYDRTAKKIQVLPYHAALSQEARQESLEAFMAPRPKHKMFLVCTDRASRGIDSLDVEHVVLFDFPRDPSEYVRRIGRTARGAGGTGKVFVFAVGKQASAARRIMDRNDRGYPIHDVPGDRYYYSN